MTQNASINSYGEIVWPKALGERAGQSHLICGSKDFEEILIVPGGLELFGVDTAFGSFLLFEQIEGDVSQDSQVFRRMVFANTATVFVQSDIQYPM